MEVMATLDRFEEQMAILLVRNGEKEIPVNWPRNYLPKAHEGDVLKISLEVDQEATRQAKNEVANLLQSVLEQQKNK